MKPTGQLDDQRDRHSEQEFARIQQGKVEPMEN
jgi:hypothetical protein